MEISWSSKSEHSSAESKTFMLESGKVLLGDPDSALKNRTVSPWLKQTLVFSLNVNNYECFLLFHGIIAQSGAHSLAPGIPIQIHGCVQLCSSSWAVLNNQRGVSFCFVSAGLWSPV